MKTESPDKMGGESPTPRTDAEYAIKGFLRTVGLGQTSYVPADFARQLERELAAAKAELARIEPDYNVYAKIQDDNVKLRARLAQLEAAADEGKKDSRRLKPNFRDVIHNAVAEIHQHADQVTYDKIFDLVSGIVVAAQTQERPEPKNPTLWRYLQNAHEKQITYHTLGVNRMPDGGFHFYIHPQSVGGDTEDFLVWPDPFNWQDMIVNRKDSPAPDFEKFKAYLASQTALLASPPARPATAGQEGLTAGLHNPAQHPSPIKPVTRSFSKQQ